ncbi:MAG: RDD family protein [Deltaproteobacteria bacterium]|nr:RDD family protein [Deltaproteobacteria bacterium]
MVRDEQGFLTATHVIRTPELVEFDFELAGLYARFLAWVIDGCIAGAISAGALFALSFMAMFASGLAGFLIFVLLFLASWGYFTFFEWRMGGRTPGKKAMGLRVVQVSGVRIEFTHAALRNLLRAFDHLPFLYAVGGGIALFAPSRRRLGDLVAGTVVVRERRRKVPANLAAGTGGPARSGLLGRLEEKLRRATVPERELLLSAALRREELDVPARLTLFAELAGFLHERFGIEKPDHLSDEKLVLEAVACLLRLEGAAPVQQPLKHAAGR